MRISMTQGMLFSDPAWQRAKEKFPKSNRTAQAMHAALQRIHGAMPGQHCGDCRFLSEHRHNKTWFKCEKSAVGGPATDWRKKYEACGLFENRGQ